MAELYRKSALEKISSPEQLDKTLVITAPSSWITLIAITILVIATVIWGIFGSIPITVSSSGMIVSPIGTNAVYSSGTGTIMSVSVTEGSYVNIGDMIMTVKLTNGESIRVYSNQVGTVTNVLAKVGEEIAQGSEVIRLSPKVSADQVVVCYVPLNNAKKIERGMIVKVELLSADTQTYGRMEARVINVDSHAASAESMNNILGSNNNLSSQFTSNGAVVAVTCELYPDERTVSGYYWSNKKGYKLEVTNGSLINAKIVTEEIAPITKLFSTINDILED